MLVGQVGKVGSDWRGGGRCGRLATTAWVDNRTVGRPHAVASTAGRGVGVVVQAVVVVRWKVVNTGRSNGRGRRQARQAERASSSKSASQCSQRASKRTQQSKATQVDGSGRGRGASADCCRAVIRGSVNPLVGGNRARIQVPDSLQQDLSQGTILSAALPGHV